MPVLQTVKVVAALGTLSSVVWVSTFASFSDQGGATSGSFTTGTLDLKLNGLDDGVVLSTLALANARPGDTVYAPLTLSAPSATSSLPLTYGMSAAASGDGALGLALTVGVRSGVTACDAAGYLASGSNVVAPGTSLAAVSVSGRSLASGASEVLCVQLSLPSSVTDNSLQGRSAGATFSVTASS